MDSNKIKEFFWKIQINNQIFIKNKTEMSQYAEQSFWQNWSNCLRAN